MKVAVLAWGSLIWNPEILQTTVPFVPNGPLLPIEFCRVSTTGARKGFLTLVIDRDDGTLCKTYAAPSALPTLEEAIANLQSRERTTERNIGFIDVLSGQRSDAAADRRPEVETIAAWAQANGYDAAIWTALESNFREVVGEPFSVTAAMQYLETLEGQDANTFASALDHIRSAPSEVETAVRDAVVRRWPAPSV